MRAVMGEPSENRTNTVNTLLQDNRTNVYADDKEGEWNKGIGGLSTQAYVRFPHKFFKKFISRIVLSKVKLSNA